MDARRFRKDSAQRLAEFRWWGCVLLAMFALVQLASRPMGSTPSPQPVNATRIAPATSNDVSLGDLPIHIH